MPARIRFLFNRLGERLWVKPFVMCILSIAGVFLAQATDRMSLGEKFPTVTLDSVDTLLTTMAASMLVIATFSVASMVSAYSSASNMATPRTFTLVVADDVSQNALSTFIGAFIFSIVALVTLKNSFFGDAGLFTLFVLTLLVFAIVIGMFVRWVDRIARLGRVGSTIEKVERAAAKALRDRRSSPTLGARPVDETPHNGEALYSSSIGYVQHIDVKKLQACAKRAKLRIRIAAPPGTFAAPGRPLAHLFADSGAVDESQLEPIQKAFLIGEERIFDHDPRFGLIVLSEVASRALSPGVNDPGTAIDIIGRLVRLFALWVEPRTDEKPEPSDHDRVEAPEMALADMFDDAFPPIARDGADTIEVVVRMMKALHSLSAVGHEEMRELALQHARLTLARAEIALDLQQDREVARKAAAFAFAKQ
ncbi:MAG TPA: DUF2254 domain-containing protein [Woeseiaceae bacterium]